MADARIYGAVLAHKEGNGPDQPERVLPARFATLAEAEAEADRWTRRHGHRPLGTDKCGWYAYGDRITRPAFRVYLR